MLQLHRFIKSKSYHDLERLREILSEADLADQDDEGYTSLHVAVMKIHTDPEDIEAISLVVRELINHGVEVNKVDNSGKSPLHYAVILRNCKIIELLLQSNAAIDIKDNDENAPLHFALLPRRFQRQRYEIREEVVTLLLEYNEDHNIRDGNGRTPLILAVQNGNFHIVKTILDRAPMLNLQDKDGKSAMHHALDGREPKIEIMQELCRQGAESKLLNKDGNTPILHYLLRLNSSSEIELEAAKKVLRFFLIVKLSELDTLFLIGVMRMEKPVLVPFIKKCHKEIRQMYNKELDSGIYV